MEVLSKLRNKKYNVTETNGYWITLNGNRLLDILCGNTAYIFGYNNKAILNAMNKVQNEVAFIKDASNEHNDYNSSLVEKICNKGNFDGLAWAVSGSDGVEVAVYTNDNYWKHKGINKPNIVTFDPNYHGATYLTKIFRGDYQQDNRCISIKGPGWELLSDREQTENDCLDRLDQLLKTNNTIGAVLMEGAPWIGRFRPWSKNWWLRIREICDRYNINLIVDDVFAGFGKTGNIFTHQLFDVQPDIVSLGKSLTAGYTPLSCACATEKITRFANNDWDYSHTWTPNMAGIGAGLAVLDLFDTKKIENINNELMIISDELLDLGLIKQVTSQGLLMQLDLVYTYDSDCLIRHGLNGNFKGKNAIFICAPIIADEIYFTTLRKSLIEALNDKL